MTDDESSRGSEVPLIGRALAGKYRLDKLVGGGAMGNVYRATQVLLDRVVAVKVLHSALGADPSFQQRFRREARAASRLDHPNSVHVLDFGIEPDGLMYIVMEFLDGKDLHHIIYDDWPLSLERVVDIMSQTLSALAIAHDAGIVHRDLKPENIMLVKRTGAEGELVETVKVADFGIAQLATAQEKLEGGKLTRQGVVAGTPEFMSPEQATQMVLDGRSDLYSCGVVLYQMVTGKLPFEGETAFATVLKHVTEVPLPPSTHNPAVDPRLDALILQAMQKNPNDRFANARDMRLALRRIVRHDAEVTGSMPNVTGPRAIGSAPPGFDAAPAIANAGASMVPLPVPAGPKSAPMGDAPLPPSTSPSGLNKQIERTTSRGRSMVALVLGAVLASSVGGAMLLRRHDRAVQTDAHAGAPARMPTAPASVAPTLTAPVVQAAQAPAAEAAPAVAVPTAPSVEPAPSIAAAHGRPTARNARVLTRAPNAPTLAPVAAIDPVPAPAPAPAAAPAPVAVAAPAPTPAPAPAPELRGVRGEVAGLNATGGIAARPLQGRAASAASALSQCVAREARARSVGTTFATAVTATAEFEIRDRRLDMVRVNGGFPWISSCASALRPSFAGDLPPADDNEYTVTLRVALTPEH